MAVTLLLGSHFDHVITDLLLCTWTIYIEYTVYAGMFTLLRHLLPPIGNSRRHTKLEPVKVAMV